MPPSKPPAATSVEGAILAIRGQRVLLDADLAPMYGVTVKALNQAVKRSQVRFPPDFMFELTLAEAKSVDTCPRGSSMRWRGSTTRSSVSWSTRSAS